MDEETRQQRLSAKNRYNLVSSTLFLLNNWFVLFLATYLGIISILFTPLYDLWALYVGGLITFVVIVFWMWFVERWSLKFGALQPQICLLLDPYYWFHERHKLVSLLHNLEDPFAGTPFKNIISRLEGVKVGKMVFDDGFEFNEYTLIEIGDYANLNEMGLIQPHTLEEGVFKSDRVKIGEGCTLGSGANLHYGVTFGDYVVLDPNSFVMKGETADPDDTWQGNPARSIGD
jgi:non-ribosomal peptide synthetase-like protein